MSRPPARRKRLSAFAITSPILGKTAKKTMSTMRRTAVPSNSKIRIPPPWVENGIADRNVGRFRLGLARAQPHVDCLRNREGLLYRYTSRVEWDRSSLVCVFVLTESISG